MLSFKNNTFWDIPYRIGLATEVLDPQVYTAMVDNFPSESLFTELTGVYKKLSLSEINNPKEYFKFIKGSLVWRPFYDYIKSPQFRENVNQVFLGYLPLAKHLKARFEFSSLPADGGRLDPHTDIASKVATLVIPICRSGEWDPSWGGGTDILQPNNPEIGYEDYKNPLTDFDKVRTIEYAPNQCLLFLKSDSSWHSAGPLQGPANVFRRSLTINIEKSK